MNCINENNYLNGYAHCTYSKELRYLKERSWLKTLKHSWLVVRNVIWLTLEEETSLPMIIIVNLERLHSKLTLKHVYLLKLQVQKKLSTALAISDLFRLYNVEFFKTQSSFLVTLYSHIIIMFVFKVEWTRLD